MLAIAAAGALLAAGCGGGERASEPLPETGAALRLTSPAFRAGGRIPARFTCDGEDVSPPLAWRGVPRSARELALVVEDPDADRFVHWTVLRIPPRTRGLAQGRVPAGAIETENSFGRRRWGGPCPPEGDDPHRYVFALYAAGRPLGLSGDATPDDVRDALADDALARGTLAARFGR
jgi:Raf kinase inhibitor-like YbhB/YbcL family protein